MMQYRLVMQALRQRWGSDGLEWMERYYVLQRRSVCTVENEETKWETLPVVNWDDLSQAERDEIAMKLLIKPTGE